MDKKNQSLINLKKTLALEKPDKIPTMIAVQGWAYAYAGVTRQEILDDPVKCAELSTKYLDDLNVDIAAFNEIAIGPLQALKSKSYLWAPDGCTITHAQAIDDYFGPEYYAQFIENPNGFLSETALKKRIPAFQLTKQEAMECLKEAGRKFKVQAYTNQLILQKFEEKGIMNLFGGEAPLFMSPFTQIFDFFRGITGALTDLRRRPETVKEACDALMKQTALIQHYQTDVEAIKASFVDKMFPFGVSILNAECFLAPKEFEKQYMAYFKEYIGPYLEAGVKYAIIGEGSILKVADQFADLPKGSIMLLLGTDDPFKIGKIFKGKQTICGGITMDLLKYGTKQQCIDYTKRCIDELGGEGGFVFAHNSLIMSANDVNVENLREVYEFANEYGKN